MTKTGSYYALPENERSLPWLLVFVSVAALAFIMLIVVLSNWPFETVNEQELPLYKVEPTTTITAKP
jgi:hypothetical protein